MKRIGILILILCMLLGLCACYVQKEEEKEVTFTFRVTHSDGTEKEFQITTDAQTLGDALREEKLVEESADNAGLYDGVDGETADWDDGEAWWCFLENGTQLNVGIDETKLIDGAVYEAVFSHGFGE